jgi:hypothetical protein
MQRRKRRRDRGKKTDEFRGGRFPPFLVEGKMAGNARL